MSYNRELQVMSSKKVTDTGRYLLTSLGVDGKVTYIHINDYKSNKNSAIVPINKLKEVLDYV